jgi:hypothetical protein
MKKHYEKFKDFLILAVNASKSNKAYKLNFKYRIVRHIIIIKDKLSRIFNRLKTQKKDLRIFF